MSFKHRHTFHDELCISNKYHICREMFNRLLMDGRLCYSNCVKRKCENCVCRTRRYFHTYNTFSCSKNIILEEQMSACGNFSKKKKKNVT